MLVKISNKAKNEINNIFNSYNIENKFLRIYIKEISA